MTCILCNGKGEFEHIRGWCRCYCQASERPNNPSVTGADEGNPAKGILNGLLISIMLWIITISIYIWVR